MSLATEPQFESALHDHQPQSGSSKIKSVRFRSALISIDRLDTTFCSRFGVGIERSLQEHQLEVAEP
jgi:hypothetical protein